MLLLLVFQGKNLFRLLNSKHKDLAVPKNTYYRFPNYYFTCSVMIQDMDLITALQSLMALFPDTIANILVEITKLIKNKVADWIKSQALFIQTLFSDLCWES